MHLQIKRSLPVYWLDDTTLRIGAQQGHTRELHDSNGELRQLVPLLLDGTRDFEKLIRDARERLPHLTEQEVCDGISALDQSGLLEDRDSYADFPPRLQANHAFFSTAADSLESTSNHAQTRLRESHVVLLGLGGGGSAILPQLLALGIGRLTILDPDVVELDNLNRQTLYRISDVGRKKADVAAEFCRDFYPEIEVTVLDSRIDVVADVIEAAEAANCIICTIDEPAFVAQRRVNAAAVDLGIPVVFVLSQHTRGRLFSVRPRETGCMDCLQVMYEREYPGYTRQFSALLSPTRHGETAIIAPHALRLTTFAVDEAVRLITDYAQPWGLGKQIEIDYLNGSLGAVSDWSREPDCPTCGRADPERAHIFAIAAIDTDAAPLGDNA